MLNIIYEHKLFDIFPNLSIILKMFLTLSITSCEAERNFSKLSYIKNKHRTTILDKRLNSLLMLSMNMALPNQLLMTQLYTNLHITRSAGRKLFK